MRLPCRPLMLAAAFAAVPAAAALPPNYQRLAELRPLPRSVA